MNRSEMLVRDVRVKSHFVVDDEYLNGYAKLCGMNATGVYLCLCRHADKGQRSFPSIALMAEKLGISRRSVDRGIATLVEWNIILKGKLRNPETGRWWNNSYILLDKNSWKPKPYATQSHGAVRQKDGSPYAKNDSHRASHSRTKDSHKKDSHIRIRELSLEEQQARTAELRKSLTASKRMPVETT